MLRALRHRNYRLFFFGQGVSLVGTWMQTLALPWLVYLITGRAVDLGITAFAGQILTFVIAPVAGVLADRWDRRRLVIVAQILATLQAAALAALTLTGVVEVWHIIGLALFGGFIRGFEIPTRQSFIVQMVEDHTDLPNAIALNSFLVNGARLVGPALAGGIIAVLQASGTGFFGVGICFLLNAVSFVAVIAALLAMKVTPPPMTRTPRHPMTEMKEGFRYAWGSPPIRTMLLLLCVISLMGAPYATLMPIFAKDILSGDAGTLGLLMAATGVGAVLGAIFLASRQSVVGISRIVAIASAVFGTGLVAFSLSRDFTLSAILLAWAGSGMMIEMAGTNTFLQTIVDEHMRGRVMSFYTMAFMGMGPFGALIAGWMADWVGAPRTVLLGGDICIVAAVIFAINLKYLRPHVRPIYERLGLLPGPHNENPAN
jgi:MFS family permease